MNNVTRKFIKLLLCIFTCFAYPSYAQLAGSIPTLELIDSSNMIVVGRVEKEVDLWMPPITDSDGKIFTISVSKVLRGGSGFDTVSIITFNDDHCRNTELPSIILDIRKLYLFFLDTARAPSTLITKYNLQGRSLFTPYLCGTGVFELKNQTGIDMLRETEDSLGITPPTPITIIQLTGWIDSLNFSVSQALRNRLIGDSTFVDTLHGVLNHARSLVQQGDSVNCAHELVRFDKMIHGAILGFDRIRFVNIDVWSLLTSDIMYLHSNLPNVPYGYESLPAVDSLSPNSMRAGEQSFTLLLNGGRFENGATVFWNWSPRVTTFISSTQLLATIASQDIENPETATVAVVNPGGGTHGAEFVVRKSYALTINATNGTVTKSPNQASYDSASTIQLTPVPNTGYLFTKWSGNIQPSDSFSNPLSVTMNSNKTVTASFILSTDTIFSSAGSNGSISPSGSVPVTYSTNKQFTITPNSCYHIDSVIVDGVKKDSTTSYTFINVTANHTIRATFYPNVPIITSFTPTSGLSGTSVTIRGSRFSGTSSVKFNGTSATTFTVNSDTQVTATVPAGITTGPISMTNACGTGSSTSNFTAMYTITVTIAGSGTVTKSPDQTSYASGTQVTLTASPAHYYVFSRWTGDVTSYDDPVTITMDSNKNITAHFIMGDSPVKH